MAIVASLDIVSPTTVSELREYVDQLEARLDPDDEVQGYAYVDEDSDELVAGFTASLDVSDEL